MDYNKDTVEDLEPLFVMATHSFINNPNFTMNEKMVFLSLRTYSGKDNSCFPGQETLAKNLKTTRQTINNILQILEQKGALLIINQIKENNRKSSNRYILAPYCAEENRFKTEKLEKYKELQEEPQKVLGY